MLHNSGHIGDLTGLELKLNSRPTFILTIWNFIVRKLFFKLLFKSKNTQKRMFLVNIFLYISSNNISTDGKHLRRHISLFYRVHIFRPAARSVQRSVVHSRYYIKRLFPIHWSLLNVWGMKPITYYILLPILHDMKRYEKVDVHLQEFYITHHISFPRNLRKKFFWIAFSIQNIYCQIPHETSKYRSLLSYLIWIQW